LQSSLWGHICTAWCSTGEHLDLFEVFFGPTPKLFISKWLPRYCEAEISGPSFTFKEEKIWLSFKLSLFCFGYFVVVFGVFWVTSDFFGSKSSNYFS
jgi:hypothetical protein